MKHYSFYTLFLNDFVHELDFTFFAAIFDVYFKSHTFTLPLVLSLFFLAPVVYFITLSTRKYVKMMITLNF
jgi:hypothetical protein